MSARGTEASSVLTFHPGHGDQSVHGRKRGAPASKSQDKPGKGGLSGGGPGSANDQISADGGAALKAKVSKDRTKYDSADQGMASIARAQGHDGVPQSASKSEIDKMVADGAVPIYHGVHPGNTGRSAADLQDQFRSGDAYYVHGSFGSGTYHTTDRGQALRYTDRSPGSVTRSVLAPGSRVANHGSLSAEHDAFWSSIPASDKAGRALWSDIGRYASARGYDAIEVGGVINVVNRSALITQRTAG